ncbi:putative quinol monooxygenase [Clostridium beijerinckii]|uniref:putative quinol monooxygenase n=1 Tax=Clostridium beijerinckii TaxID=1520 RepID=UPI000479EE05|nr:antibiotic biosynthesis monooxygenase [Clostridium beijerinckii]
MIVKSVTIYVKQENIEKFIKATKENQNNSLKENGIVCFDLFQSKDDSARFLLYEGYKSEDDVNKHMETEHFKKWINIVEPWFSAPRDKATYIPVP